MPMKYSPRAFAKVGAMEPQHIMLGDCPEGNQAKIAHLAPESRHVALWCSALYSAFNHWWQTVLIGFILVIRYPTCQILGIYFWWIGWLLYSYYTAWLQWEEPRVQNNQGADTLPGLSVWSYECYWSTPALYLSYHWIPVAFAHGKTVLWIC